MKKAKRQKVIIGATAFGILGLLIYYKSLFVVAWVNGRPITSISFVRELVHTGGQQILNDMITQKLVLQEAKKQKVSVGDAELQEEMNQLEQFAQEQQATLDQLLEIQGMKRADLLEQIRWQKLVTKLAGTESAQIQEWLANLQAQAKVSNWIRP
jgi:parvulin-like peptidyl-prolyl isomerase